MSAWKAGIGWLGALAYRGQLRRFLLLWTLGPITVLMVMDTASLYRNTLSTTASAHDRLLQATAQQMGDLLRVERNSLTIHVPLALIEALEGSGGSRMYWRVIGFDGRQIAGDVELPLPSLAQSVRTPGISFSYQAQVAGEQVQVSALHQAVEMSQGQGLALILVAETLEARSASAAALLRDMLVRQLLLMLVVTGLVWLVTRSALRPLDLLRQEIQGRSVHDHGPMLSKGPEELQPVIDAMNQLISRQQELMTRQRRFIADASHQLRTPLTVLKTQLQSVLCGDVSAEWIVPDMLRTVDRSSHLANQLLNHARVDGQRQAVVAESLSVEALAREAVLELSSMIAAKRLAFTLEADSDVTVHGNAWMLGELIRNLLANAIRHAPPSSALGLRVFRVDQATHMVVWDHGPGISDDMRVWLFQPFASVRGVAGAGLGLSICLDIATTMHARIALNNRLRPDASVEGLDAVVVWD